MKILITGANSLLGKYLYKSAPQNHTLLLTDLPARINRNKNFPVFSLNITNKNQISKTFQQFKPQAVIHLAAISNVDYCQKNKNRAANVNIKGTQNIIKVCIKYNSKLIFTSTNSIFSGNKPPKYGYTERSQTKPLHTYGKTKLAAENIVKKSHLPFIIVRLITMYGWAPKKARENPVTWTLEKLKQHKNINMVNDNFVNPLYASSAADAIWKLINKQVQGTFHIAGKTRVNRYQWSKKIAHTFGFPTKKIKSVSSDFFSNITPRPQDTCLSTVKLQNSINWKPQTLKQGLTLMKNETK